MPSKLELFNNALLELGHRSVSDTGEGVESARAIVDVYNQVLSECLAAGSWNFAMETIKIEADTGVTPEFGYTEIFAKPSDWLRTISVSLDEYLSYPLIHYYDDANFWSADTSPLYIRYVSNDTGLGMELNRWPPNFTRYVELQLAERICMRVTQDNQLRDQIRAERDRVRMRALNQDAMNEPQPKYTPPGNWTASRGGRRLNRGKRNTLTG